MIRTSLTLLLALTVVPAAHAVPDVCDVGGGALTGTLALTPGAARGLTSADAAVLPVAAGDRLGRAVVVADLNGDGHDDLAVSIDGDDTNGPAAGAVAVWFGPMVGDLLPATADSLLLGAGAGFQAGVSLAAADVDGDGADDLLVGSLGGAAWLVTGATLIAETSVDLGFEADATFVGSAFEGFGSAVGLPGDLDGDGFGDLAIGAPRAVVDGLAVGSAWVFSGPVTGTQALGEALVRLDGVSEGGGFGSSLGPAGDVDGDGRDDLAVAAVRDSTAGSRAGAVYVWHGAQPWTGAPRRLADSADLAFFGARWDRLGSAITPAGDVDGDGKDELWLGAWYVGGFKQGSAWLLPGGLPDGRYAVATRATSVVRGWRADDTVGTAIVAGLDVDGDGQEELLLGGARAAGSVAGSGAAWMLQGPLPTGASRIDAHTARFPGLAFGDQAGAALAAGDLDNDGYDDVVVGAWHATANGRESGLVSIVRGGADPFDLTPWYADRDLDGYGDAGDVLLACEAPDYYVADAGDCDDTSARWRPSAPEGCAEPDYNCDGFTGPTDADDDGYTACGGDCDDGDANVSPAAADLCGDGVDSDCNGEVDGPTATDATTWYPDSDGDGYGNRVAGFRSCERPTGVVPFLTLGGDCRDGDRFINPAALERCNSRDDDCDNLVDESDAVDAATWYRDLDDDGFGDPLSPQRGCTQPGDVLNGQPVDWVANRGDCDDTRPGVKPGATETCNFVDDDCDGALYLGGTVALDDRAFVRLLGESGANVGAVVRTLGDLDLDGDDEVVVALPAASVGADRGGLVLVRRGGPDGGTTTLRPGASTVGGWQVQLIGTRKEAAFGAAVATGDFDGDGAVDLAVGAPGARVPSLGQGAVYVFYGPLADGVIRMEAAGTVLRGAVAGEAAGTALAAGDVDGDGFADLLIGSPLASTSDQSRRGRASVWFGAAERVQDVSLATLPGLNGLDARDEAGQSVALVDLDADGRDELVIGSPKALDLDRGVLLVRHGSASRTLSTPDALLFGAMAGEGLGTALAGVGDVDGDGREDLLAGTGDNSAWLLRGRAAPSTDGSIGARAQLRFSGPIGASVGRALAGAGDVDGDGLADMLLGAPDEDTSGRDAGAIYLVYGSASYTDVVALGGTTPLDRVESFGRLDAGSTFPTRSAANLGRLHGARILGRSEGDRLGRSVASGDVDGDGLADLLLGAPGADGAGAEGGEAAVLLGSPYGVDLAVADGTERTWFWDRDLDGATDLDGAFTSCPMHVPTDLDAEERLALDAPSVLGDCDDGDASVRPCADERAGDGIDSNCDGVDVPVADADADGLSLSDELALYGTCPDLSDTDGDGVDDGDEVRRGSNPLDAGDLVLGVEDLRAGDLRITEVLVDALGCDEPGGELVEVAYAGVHPLDLDTLGLETVGATGGVDGRTLVLPGARILLARDAVAFQACYGLTPTAEGLPELADVGDRVRLTVGGVVLDEVDLRTWAITSGTSWQRDEAGGSWCIARTTGPSGDLATPGLPNSTCVGTGLPGIDTVSAGQLLVTEIMSNASACGDEGGEYIELRWLGAAAVELTGLRVQDLTGTTTLGSLTVGPGGRVVLARNAASYAACYGLPAAGAFAFTLDDAGERIRLLKPSGTILDEIDVRPWPAGAGASFERDDSAARWCLATDLSPTGDRGTPGTSNGACPVGDFDVDGLVDATESCLGLSPWRPDFDLDGLLDGDEVLAGTNPHGASGPVATAGSDLDSDGATYAAEVAAGTDPWSSDSDADGLLDGAEAGYATGACTPDSDGDTVRDGLEVGLGFDPAAAASHPRRLSDLTTSDLRVTEVHADAGACSDSDGEFFEVLVLGTGAVVLDGLIAEDASGARFTVSGGLVGSPGDRLVFARGSTYSTCYGAAPSAVTGLVLDNGGDRIRLLRSSTVLAEIDYRSIWTIRPGVSRELDDVVAGRWCDAEDAGPNADLASPGAANGTCPDPNDPDRDGLASTLETCAGTNPAVGDTDGDGTSDGLERAARTNPRAADPTVYSGASDADLDGQSYDSEVLAGTDPFNADSDADGLDDGEEAALGTLPCTADTDADGVRDGVEVDLGFSATSAASRPRVITDLVASDLLITEVLPWAQACSDADGEFIEVVYNGAVVLLADGLQVTEAGGASFTFPAGSVVQPGERFVLARGAGFTTCYGVAPKAVTGLPLDDSGDRVRLRVNGSTLVELDFRSGWTLRRGISRERDDLASSVWCDAEDAVGATDLASPGAANGTCPPANDPDRDTLLTALETCLGTDASDADSDGDGLADGAERAAGTDPGTVGGPVATSDSDLDGDGLTYAAELAAGSDPWRADTDGDRSLDGDEVTGLTGVCTSDTDGDGVMDGLEVELGTDPRLSTSRPSRASDLRPGDLRITELLVDPVGCSDTDGEFFEVLVLAAGPWVLDGLLVEDASGTRRTVSGGVGALSGERLVFARGAGFSACHGVLPDVVTSLVLDDGGDLVRLLVGALTIDQVDSRTGSAWSFTPGRAKERDDSESRAWCNADTVTTSGDFASPGASNGACPADLDGDGLSFLAELCLHTDPWLADSDGDGRSDAVERAEDTNPHGPDHVVTWTMGGTIAGLTDPTALVSGAVQVGDGVEGWIELDVRTGDINVRTDVGEYFQEAPSQLDLGLSLGNLDLAATDGAFVGSAYLQCDDAALPYTRLLTVELARVGTGGGTTAQLAIYTEDATSPVAWGRSALPRTPFGITDVDLLETSVVVQQGARTATAGVDLTHLTRDDDRDGLDHASEALQGTDAWTADSDGDGLGDAEEADLGTLPCLADSDGDAASDGAEVAAGTDPLDPADRP